jgi:hypothetical protein
VDARAEVLQVALQVLLVFRHHDSIDPALAASVAGMLVRAPVMQQSGELGLDGPAGRRVHPREVGWQGDPALRPEPALVAWDPLELVPSLDASRFSCDGVMVL